jgi:DNA invertase Pin-like site-specific DNA recombinase
MIGLASNRRWPLSTPAIVGALDRLGRSLPYLLQIVTTLQAQGVAFRVLLQELPVIEYKRLQATDLNLHILTSGGFR